MSRTSYLLIAVTAAVLAIGAATAQGRREMCVSCTQVDPAAVANISGTSINYGFIDAGTLLVRTQLNIATPTDSVVTVPDGAFFCNASGNICLRWHNGIGALFTGVGFTSSGAIISGIASGNNGLAVSTNGARVDFGAGASDYASSDGTTVTFAGPVTVAGLTSSTNTNIALGANGQLALGTGTSRFNVSAGAMAISVTAPTLSGFCTSPTVTASNGTAAFLLDVGSSCAASTGTITLPTATTGWNCECTNRTSGATRMVTQTSSTTTTCVLQSRDWAGTAANWVNGDDISCIAMAY